MHTYRGSCHCGQVTFEVSGAPEEITTCDCSICTKKNALMWKVPEDRLTILTGANKLSRYRWNTGIAEHFFCSICGIYTFHKKRLIPDHFGVNVFCLEGFSVDNIPTTNTEGKSLSVE